MRNIPHVKFYHFSRWIFCLLSAIVVVKFLCIHQYEASQNPSDWSLQHVLPKADQVNISQISDGQQYQITSLPGDNKRMLLLLKQTKHFGAIPPKMKPDFVFEVPIMDNKLVNSTKGLSPYPIYNYVSKSGELGIGKDWCYVPDKFRVWMQISKAKTPVRKFRVERTPYYTSVQEVKPYKAH